MLYEMRNFPCNLTFKAEGITPRIDVSDIGILRGLIDIRMFVLFVKESAKSITFLSD